MNITKLISPIQLHRDRDMLCIHHTTADMEDTLDTHTPISTPNQLPHQERSYFKPLQTFQKQNQSSNISSYIVEQNSKLIAIDNKLFEINEMKQKFANKRKNESQLSLQRTGNRSIDRHHLKPSPVPKINAQTSQFSAESLSSVVNEKNKRQQTFSFKMERPEIINVDHRDLFQDSHFEEMVQTKRKSQISKQANRNCKCQGQFQSCMIVIKRQIQQLLDRTAFLQKSNKEFKEKQDKSQSIYSTLIKNIKNMEKKQLQTSQNSIKKQIKEIEFDSSLKIATFRQKQPMKENSWGLQSSERKRIDKINSRAKVQALLQRLQLRIQKS